MRYLLDTNIVIFVLKDRGGKAAARLAQESPADVATCAVVEAELYHGATKYGAPDRRRSALVGFLAPYRSLAFDSAGVPNYARIRDELERAGQVIGGNDLLIELLRRLIGRGHPARRCHRDGRGLRGGDHIRQRRRV